MQSSARNPQHLKQQRLNPRKLRMSFPTLLIDVLQLLAQSSDFFNAAVEDSVEEDDVDVPSWISRLVGRFGSGQMRLNFGRIVEDLVFFLIYAAGRFCLGADIGSGICVRGFDARRALDSGAGGTNRVGCAGALALAIDAVAWIKAAMALHRAPSAHVLVLVSA